LFQNDTVLHSLYMYMNIPRHFKNNSLRMWSYVYNQKWQTWTRGSCAPAGPVDSALPAQPVGPYGPVGPPWVLLCTSRQTWCGPWGMETGNIDTYFCINKCFKMYLMHAPHINHALFPDHDNLFSDWLIPNANWWKYSTCTLYRRVHGTRVQSMETLSSWC
jgi:hypothetical protein